jgi:hypothetical protein
MTPPGVSNVLAQRMLQCIAEGWQCHYWVSVCGAQSNGMNLGLGKPHQLGQSADAAGHERHSATGCAYAAMPSCCVQEKRVGGVSGWHEGTCCCCGCGESMAACATLPHGHVLVLTSPPPYPSV